jgi:hypothetical protein
MMTFSWQNPLLWLAALPAAFGVYLLLAMYVYAPLKVKQKEVKPLDVCFDPVQIDDLPNDVVEAFYKGSQGLAACGFRSLGTVRRYSPEYDSDSFVSVWVNASAKDAAQVIGVRTPSPLGGHKVATLVTFGTEFTDETQILTSNTKSAGVFPKHPLASPIRCPGVLDYPLLYRFHRARVQRDARGRTPTLERVTDPAEVMRREHAETFDFLTRAGYFVLNQADQCYEATLKGAYLMTYRLLPPFKQIQKLRRDRLADRTLRELGFGGLKAFTASQRPAAS